MPVERTGVYTAAMAASDALELLASVLKISGAEPGSREAAKREAENLQAAAEEDVAAYNRYLLDRDPRPTIEIPIRAAQAVSAGIELCAAAKGTVKRSVAADLGVAAALLDGALRGILLCVEANLAQVAGDHSYDALRTEAARLSGVLRS